MNDRVLATILLLVALAILAIIMSIVAIVRSRRRARAAGFDRIIDHLRAVPRNDWEKREAVAMMLRGLVICVLGIVVQPLMPFGIVPLYYGGRKVVLALLGLDLLGEADDAGSQA